MRRAHLPVLLLMVGLVALYSWPLVTDLPHLYPDNPDARVLTWAMITAFRNLLTHPGALMQGNAFYPVGLSLTFSEPLFTPALVAGPIHAATGNPVFAYNVTLILFWAISGWAMYAVAIRVTRDRVAALLAALVFMLCPYRTDMYIEFNMEMTFGIPLAFYTLVRFLESQRPRDLALFCLVFWLQAISVLYYAVIVGFGLGVVALQYVALRWSGWRRSTPVTIAVGGVGLGVALAPVMLPFTVTRRELGFERSLNEVHDRSAEVLSYFDVRSNWLYRMKEAGYVYEATLFMGAVALGLALLGLLWLRRGRPAVRGWPDRVVSVGMVAAAVLLGRAVLIGITSGSDPPPALSFTVVSVALLGLLVARQALDGWRRHQQGLVDRRLGPRDWVLILLGLSLVAFLLSLGPVVNMAGRPVGPGLFAWLQPYVLPLRALRAANRIGVLVVFAVSLLAALGVTWLRAHLPRRAFAPVMAAVGLLLLLEYATFPMSYGRVPALLRPVDVVLKGASPDAVVLEWPTYAPMADADAMFRSIGHRKRVVNGYSGFVPQFLNKLSGLLTQPGPPFPVPAVEAYLRHIYPLDLLVVRLTDGDLAPPWRAAWRELRQAPPPFLHFHGSYGEEDLWDVSVGPERGVVAERWVSFDFISEHPVLRAMLRPLLEDPELEQSARVSLNGRTIDQGRIDQGQPLTMTLPPPYHQAAFNVVTLAYRYRRAKALDDRYRVGTTRVLSSGDLRVQSAGQPYGESASIVFNGVELAPNRRGYNLAALTPDGRFHATGVFDTFFDPNAARQLAAFIRSLPEGTLVAGAVRDEASGLLSDAAVAALRTLGVAGDLRGHFRESHAFIGVKGAAPGTALEELGPRALVLTIGQPPATIGFEIQSFALERAAGQR